MDHLKVEAGILMLLCAPLYSILVLPCVRNHTMAFKYGARNLLKFGIFCRYVFWSLITFISTFMFLSVENLENKYRETNHIEKGPNVLPSKIMTFRMEQRCYYGGDMDDTTFACAGVPVSGDHLL